MKKYVYGFHEGSAAMRALLGGKGANLAEMTKMGLPVPPGMTVTTEACREYLAVGKKLPAGLLDEVALHLAEMERKVDKKFGDPANPLLKAKNCFITPHISWATGAARKRLMTTTVENIRAFLTGTPQNVVNG